MQCLSVCFRMMDVESGQTSAARGGSRLPRVFAAASTFVSCLALGGVFLLVLHNQSLQTEIDGLQQATQSAVRVQDNAQKKIARREVSMEMEKSRAFQPSGAVSTGSFKSLSFFIV